MKIIVCVRQGLDGEISPFDASAYEEALKIDEAEITLLSMGAPSAFDFLLKLTRLGAKNAVLLTDKAFAGADTLATAYALSLAIKKLSPELVFCGRQTLIGDTAQTPVMLAEMLKFNLITNVMKIEKIENNSIFSKTREGKSENVSFPALITVEKISSLRFPRLRSKMGEVTVWSAADIGADVSKCGLAGSPTRVIKTFENQSGKRKCTFISRDKLTDAIEDGLKKSLNRIENDAIDSKEKLSKVFIVGSACEKFAKDVSDNIVDIGFLDADTVCDRIKCEKPDAVIFGSDASSKRLSATVAARLSFGLTADCTRLECENGELIMYRPALSGSIIAKIKSLTTPAMATVRTETDNKKRIIVGVGFGAKDSMDKAQELALQLDAELVFSRKLVDNGYAKYESQVGLTGKTVSPPVYIAIGISGAVHHVVGIQRSGTIIAINPDPKAPIFEYADYGIIDEF